MARRTPARQQAVAYGADTAVHEEAALTGSMLEGPVAVDPSRYPADGAGGRRGRRSGWRGSGGRWWIWMGRAVLWALILVLLVNGVRASFDRFTQEPTGSAAAPTGGDAKSKFPSSRASAFALQFASVYLNYDGQTAPDREQRLAPFVPEGSGQLGWNGVGNLRMEAIGVAGVDVRDEHNAIVTLLARDTQKWFSLAVPVYTADGAMVVAGEPALLAPPARAALPEPRARERDTGLEGALRQPLDGFFRGYGGSDQTLLSQFTDGPPITGLDGAVTFRGLNEIVAPRGGADRRTVTAEVTWQVPPTSNPRDPAAELNLIYELDVVSKNGHWYVSAIRGATPPTTP